MVPHAALHNAQKPHAAHAAFAQTPYYKAIVYDGEYHSEKVAIWSALLLALLRGS